MKAFLFDLDDTLISEKEYARSGYRAVAQYLFEHQMLSESYETVYASLTSLFEEDAKNVFNRLFEHFHVPYEVEDIRLLVRVYREHKPEILYHKDVMATLNGLREKGMKLGIISDGYAVTQRNKVEALGADKLFDEIILTDELGREFWKPSPKAFELMQERMQIPYEEMMYVGDNPEKDFLIAKELPIQTARIYREDGVYYNHPYREGVKENYPIKSLEELLLI